jgi:two-component system nitrate/nitrite response regulator NarP
LLVWDLSPLLAVLPDLKVVMLSGMVSRDDVERALDAGASGYIMKDEELAVMVVLVFRAATGDSVLSQSATDALKSRNSS